MPNAKKPIIKLDKISKKYDEYGVLVKALDSVSLKIFPGEFVSIIGPSGSGKSTLLHCMGLLDRPSSGAVYIDEDNNVLCIVEKPPKGTSTTNLNNAGLMVLSPDIFEFTAKIKLSPRGEYELTDVFTMLHDKGKAVKGFRLSGYWKDVGTPEDLDKINQMF